MRSWLPAAHVRLAVIALYLARPFSCAWALSLEPRSPENPYHSIDPHGFGVLGAMLSGLVFAVPVLWLLLQRREASAPVPARALAARSAAVLLGVGSPMLLQLSYLPMPIAYDWPVIVSSVAWFAAVLALCLYRGDRLPSVHAAFDRRPRLTWATVAAIALLKVGTVLLILVER